MMKKISVDSMDMNALNLNSSYYDYAPTITHLRNASVTSRKTTARTVRCAADITRIVTTPKPEQKRNKATPFKLSILKKTSFFSNNRKAAVMTLPIYPARRKLHIKAMQFRVASFFPFMLYTISAIAIIICFSLLTAFVNTNFAKWRLSSFASSLTFERDTALTGNMYGYVLPAKEITDSDIPLGSQVLPPVSYQTYTVRSGDSISTITSRFGLRNISTLLAVNNIENARRLRAGQKLTVPSMDGIAHTVTKGESVSSISGLYRVPETALMDANSLESSVLTPNTRLFIPGASLSKATLRKVLGETFLFPVRGRLTSPYGYRADPFTGVRKFHTGIDIANARGTPVRAALDGKVSVVGTNSVYGKYVIMIHDGNYQTLYAHLDSIDVKKGQYIDSRTTLGKMGSTGYSTGSHLHFSVYKNGTLINPFSVLDRGKLQR